MPSRPVFHPEIGQFFIDLREGKRWTQRQAEDIAKRRRLTALTRQVLWRLEKGKVKNIEPEILRAVADLYDVPYPDLVTRWVSHRYQPEAMAAAAPTETSRVIALERRTSSLDAAIADASAAVAQAAAALAGDKNVGDLLGLAVRLDERRRAALIRMARRFLSTQPGAAADVHASGEQTVPRRRSNPRARRASSL